MKVMSIADIHLQGGMDSDEAIALMRAAQIAIRERVSVVCVNGDIFEKASTPEQRLVFKKFLEALSDYRIETVIIRGNHDESKDLMVFDGFCGGAEGAALVSVFERPDCFYPRSQPSFKLCMIPHFNAGGLAQEAASLDEIGETGSNLFEDIIRSFRTALDNHDGPGMVIFHGTLTDAQLDNGHIPRANGIHLNATLLSTLGVPVRGGHYHAAQEVAPNVRYSGSITLQTFGESGDKGVLIDTFDGKNHVGCEFVSLDPTPRITINAEFKPDDTLGVTTLGGFYFQDFVSAGECQSARVRFRYTVREEDLPRVDLTEVRGFFADAGALELKIEREVMLQTAARAEEILGARTVWDMFTVWLSLKGMQDRAEGLEALYNQVCRENTTERENTPHETEIAVA